MGLRVLIVDDALFMRNMLKDIFTNAGHSVVGEAANGDEAITQYAELKPDLVTMDIVMPQKSGIEALQEIRKRAVWQSDEVVMVEWVSLHSYSSSSFNS